MRIFPHHNIDMNLDSENLQVIDLKNGEFISWNNLSPDIKFQVNSYFGHPDYILVTKEAINLKDSIDLNYFNKQGIELLLYKMKMLFFKRQKENFITIFYSGMRTVDIVNSIPFKNANEKTGINYYKVRYF